MVQVLRTTTIWSRLLCNPSSGRPRSVEKDILKEVQHEMESGSKEEVVVKAMKKLMMSSTKSVKSLEWSLENGILYHRGKVYVPNSDLQCCVSALCHDSKIAGHARRWKTLELVSRNYWWPQMSRYIGR